MTSPECVNCVESLFRSSACVHQTCGGVGTEVKRVCVCLRDNECNYNRQNTVRDKSIKLLAAVTQQLNVLLSGTLDKCIATSLGLC